MEANPESNGFSRFDILLDGRYSSWIKFANSLRMRLAMRISAVEPDKACVEFQEGLNNEYGVFEAETERVAVSTKSGYTNPLGELNLVWNETYMSASMESIISHLVPTNSLKTHIAVSVRGRAFRILIMPDCQN